MKKIVLSCLTVVLAGNFVAAQEGVSAKLKELHVPNSPAFVLVDLTPSVFQPASTPKEFILGVAQSYQQSSDGFPQNYSAEFAPYWWINPGGRNVYNAVGLRTTRDSKGAITNVGKENPFSGLKFTTVSLAFISKDLIPDTVKVNQKVVSIGIKTTLIKVHAKNYGSKLAEEIKNWHTAAMEEFENNREVQDKLARYEGDDEEKYQQELLNNFKTERTGKIVKTITELVSQKPLFSWDIAGAFATYGINDSVWKTGRSGIWTTISSYLPLALNDATGPKNYISLNAVFRYLTDKYQQDKQKKIVRVNNVDVGGKLSIELGGLSLGFEALHRFKNGKADAQNRTVGVINYRISENLYLQGAFGKNFNTGNRLISLFGINWGIGSETVKLPD